MIMVKTALTRLSRAYIFSSTIAIAAAEEEYEKKLYK